MKVGQQASGLSVHMAQSFNSTFFILPTDFARTRAASACACIDWIRRAASFGQVQTEMGLIALAIKEAAAKFGLERLDGSW